MLGFRQVLSALRLFAFAWIAIAALCTLSGFSDAEAKDFRILRLINGINRPDLACCTPFYIFHTPVIEGDRVAFMSRNGGPDGVWSANIKTRALTKLVGLGTPVPGGTGNFSAFYIDSDKRLTIGGGRVAFFAADSAGMLGLFVVSVNGGAITRIASTAELAPDGEVFIGLSNASLNGQYVAFQGSTSLHQYGVYRATVAGTGLVTVMDTDDRLDARTTSGPAVDYFNVFGRPVMLNGSSLAFGAGGLFDPVSGANAIFRSGETTPIADNLTALAGRPDTTHVRITNHSSGIGTGEVAFLADQPNNGFSGIFKAGNPDSAPAYVTTNAFVPGTTRKFTSFGGFGHDASGVAFTGFSPVTSGTEYSVNFLAGLGQPVERIAASPEYYFPIVGDRSVSQGRVVFMENSNYAATVFVAVPDSPADLLIDFGDGALWERLNNTTWLKIHPTSPLGIGAGDLNGDLKDEVIASYSSGLWARYNATWVKLHTSVPTRFVTGDLDGNGLDEVIADFGSTGIWIRFNNANPWQQLHPAASQALAVGDLDGNGKDEVLIDVGASGLWVRFNNATWVKLHAASPTYIATGDLDGSGKDDAVIDFGSSGIFVRFNNATWTQLHSGTSQGIVTGDLDGSGKDDVLIDFGAGGLWARYNNATWTKLHSTSPVNMTTADLDGSGKDEAVIDFGASLGLYVRYNNATWTKLHSFSTQGLAAGNFD